MGRKKPAFKYSRRELVRHLGELRRDVAMLDWESLPEADVLAPEEVEAARVGAVAGLTSVMSLVGAFGERSAENVHRAGSKGQAVSIGRASLRSHLEFVVLDGPAAPKVSITIEHEG